MPRVDNQTVFNESLDPIRVRVLEPAVHFSRWRMQDLFDDGRQFFHSRRELRFRSAPLGGNYWPVVHGG